MLPKIVVVVLRSSSIVSRSERRSRLDRNDRERMPVSSMRTDSTITRSQ